MFCMKFRSLGLPVCFCLCLKPIFCEIHAFFWGKNPFPAWFYTYILYRMIFTTNLPFRNGSESIKYFSVLHIWFLFGITYYELTLCSLNHDLYLTIGKKPISRMYLFPIFCFCHTHGFFSMGRIHSPHDLCRFIIELIIFCSIIILTNLHKGWSHPFQYLYEEMVSLSFVQ